MGETGKADEDALLKEFFAEVGEVERDNEVIRILSCFKLNPFEHLNLPFDSSVEDVKRQYRKHWRKHNSSFLINKKGTTFLAKSKQPKRYEQQYEQSEEFQQQLKLKVRQILTEQEWRRRKMAMRISEEEGRLKKDEEEQKEIWKRKREHEEQWEGTREQRVSSWRDFMKSGKKGKKGEIRPPKLKTEDPNKSYVQRPVKRG
ncbi:hypothetical protein Cgig2_022476 [Carnegiea gigantea]|uniref:Uncharacterized protein n=1 Tax=Carnegiea gigantea TaxID=171969 RepID=A0A9Q1K9F8_9CARY|nr:hypothetical protein Cgig2_022476 [Carnegiea gigantea]